MNKYALRFFVPDCGAYAIACALDLPIQYSNPDELIGHFAIIFDTEADRKAFSELVEELYE